MVRRPPRSTRTDTLLPDTTRFRAGDLDVGPGEPLALRNVALQLDVVREAEWQVAVPQRVVGRGLLAPHAVAALAVQHLPGPDVALGGRHHVGEEPDRAAGRLAAPRGRSEERRVGTGGGGTCRSGWSAEHEKKKQKQHNQSIEC